MINYQGKWALITGASSGIGETFAIELAKKGTNVILVARREDRLNALANKLREAYKIEVDVCPIDLIQTDAPKKLFDLISRNNRSVKILINNAGFGVFGRLHEADLQKNQEQILVNVYALTYLTQLFLPAMVKDNEGAIINVASTAAFQPCPYLSVYGATKAFVLTFTEALWAEYQHSNIHILALCPGPVATEFFNALGKNHSITGPRDTAETIVTTALSALDNRKIYVIPGAIKNYILANLGRFSPRSITAKISEMMLRPK